MKAIRLLLWALFVGYNFTDMINSPKNDSQYIIQYILCIAKPNVLTLETAVHFLFQSTLVLECLHHKTNLFFSTDFLSVWKTQTNIVLLIQIRSDDASVFCPEVKTDVLSFTLEDLLA